MYTVHGPYVGLCIIRTFTTIVQREDKVHFKSDRGLTSDPYVRVEKRKVIVLVFFGKRIKEVSPDEGVSQLEIVER